MRKAKVVYLDGSHERELVIPPELLFDSEKKEKFIKDRIGNVDYTEYRYYDESDENFGNLPEQISDNSELINDNAESVAELPPPISEVSETSVTNVEQPTIEVLTAEIKMYLHIANQSIIEVGKRLILAKELVPHGEWLNWLQNNLGLTRMSANNFMNVAKRFSNVKSILHFKNVWNFYWRCFYVH